MIYQKRLIQYFMTFYIKRSNYMILDVLQYIDNNLFEKVRITKINKVNSDSIINNIGVPQGYALYPLLCLTYINDLPDLVRYNPNKYKLLIDDDNTLKVSSNQFENLKIIHICLYEMSKWFEIYY